MEQSMNKVAVIGTGYVGLVTGAMLADRGNNVVCIDNNNMIIERLKSGKIHIYEPGLSDIVKQSVLRKNLEFSMNIREVEDATFIFLAVGTPSKDTGEFDLTYLMNAAHEVGEAIKDSHGFKIIIVKSTVPQGTNAEIARIIDKYVMMNNGLEVAYVSNPETLAEGTAVNDFAKPDRIIIGTHSDKAFEMMKSLYHPFVRQRGRILRGTPADAELAKLFSNTALATRVAMVDEFSRIADVTRGADIERIRIMVCEDSRIGYSFMYPGPGYGGSCFPKDIQGLVDKSMNDGYEPLLLSKVHTSNETHKNYVASKVINSLERGSTVAVWGVTFKPNTDDIRDSPAIKLITRLIQAGMRVQVYDPKDVKARDHFITGVAFCKDKYDALENADAVVLMTEWKEFDAPDISLMKTLMRGYRVFDYRNRWIPEMFVKHGFSYEGVGRRYGKETL